MKHLTEIKTFRSKEGAPELVLFGEESYHFSRKISNSRFGHMPTGIAYCKTALHVKLCIDFCSAQKVPFRIRSGGHQHEGMCSSNNVLIIDLSRMYDAKIHDDHGAAISAELETAWIPVGMKLETVYAELQQLFKTIPGGGCQSVNVGGLTQGGGWGTSIRKFGLTCDSVVDVEMVMADGTIINTSKVSYISPTEVSNIQKEDILWALRGGGGGNFGVVTKFKFQLSPLGSHVTTFGIRWKNKDRVPQVIKKWIDLQKADLIPESLNYDLSCTSGLFLSYDKIKNQKIVTAGMGGKYYGSKSDLLKHLRVLLGDYAPITTDGQAIMDSKAEQYFTAINIWTKDKNRSDSVQDDQWLADFMSTGISLEEQAFASASEIEEKKNTDMFSCMQYPSNNNAREAYTVLPSAPRSTCDQPHPHKVTSAFPKKDTNHHELVDEIYSELMNTSYYPDVNKYMIWHCMGGKSKDSDFQKNSAFPYRDKPYLLQLQCWWDNSGKRTNDEGRAEEYVKWVKDFREKILSKHTEGAFINFVDKTLVKDISNQKGRLKLLSYYYGENLSKLQKIKKALDPKNLFQFEMSIPLPEKNIWKE